MPRYSLSNFLKSGVSWHSSKTETETSFRTEIYSI